MIHRIGKMKRIRPAERLKLRRDLGVIQVGTVAAARADELKRVGVAPFHPAVCDADRLAPEACRLAMAGLASNGQRPRALSAIVQPPVTRRDPFARYGDGRTGHAIQVFQTAHSTHPRPAVHATAGGWSRALVVKPRYLRSPHGKG